MGRSTGPSRVHEEEAGGLVGAVYRDVRKRMAFVPALFKELAADEPVLLDAWLQARALLDDPDAVAAAGRYLALAEPRLAYRASPAVRAAVAPFAEDVPTMLLVVTSLRLALDGALPPGRRPEADLPPPGPVPASDVPEQRAEHPLFADIRAVYGTHHLPSIYRALAAAGLLEEPWAAVRSLLASEEGGALVHGLTAAAEDDARRLTRVALFHHERARPTLLEFAAALPRNLVFAAAVVRGARRPPPRRPARGRRSPRPPT